MATQTIEHVVKEARGQVGYTERPVNKTKYGEYYGVDGFAWCMVFIYWLLHRNDVEIMKTAYTPTGAQWFRDQGRGFTDDSKARRGDIVFFDFPDSLFRIQHVGIVTANESSLLKTIEGNTSPGSSGSQSNGGGVYARVRPYGHAVYFGRPKYARHDPLPRFDVPKARTWLRKGDEGPDVKNLQRDLNGWMRWMRQNRRGKIDFNFGRLDLDAVFDGEVKKALQSFQGHVGIEADGLFGRETEARLDKARAWQREKEKGDE